MGDLKSVCFEQKTIFFLLASCMHVSLFCIKIGCEMRKLSRSITDSLNSIRGVPLQ